VQLAAASNRCQGALGSDRTISRARSLAALGLCAALSAAPAHAGHTLGREQQEVLSAWLTASLDYRGASEADCDCAEDIQRMRAGSGGKWGAVPDYHRYRATADFNSDGEEDFAVVVVDRSKPGGNFALIVFNGPLREPSASPAFMRSGLDLKRQGLFCGPPRPKPYRLVIGPFESHGALLRPHGRTYKLAWGQDD